MTMMVPRQRRSAVPVARLAVIIATIATAATTSALAPAAHATDSYGAIAYSGNGSWGRSWAYPTKAAAEATAVKSCGYSDCKVLTSFTACGAVAAKDRDYKGGTGPNLSAAMKDALGKLDGGYIDTWACN
ncbi:hypothetical protein B1987_24160 [Mycobacterium kansasii]|uniref:DUF4189 domain-containing protein n=1 Tax=Mycobacterium attenuatum TaxID=2341086 RepID=A0A498Q8Z1_9MYCO|nr:DUF4189 domain-containing protein [Mycobacterium attenuatum]ORB83422.1 hypothetical protein B1987_05820 [Mycobacterium kansasii]ORB86356.1 hypothetical protein B1987_24160 [Mycobacterium kansasii]VBA41304.1 hypothetical protein LAUMK136_03965 [Mycobacterium attenuatum]VBA57257.1 hypothetical protein LAUMK191_03941 [Mycobacterium attenuatum]VBA60600.1 hypothetical protein LAUMK41_04082 [Mycobacterium attenuatum]